MEQKNTLSESPIPGKADTPLAAIQPLKFLREAWFIPVTYTLPLYGLTFLYCSATAIAVQELQVLGFFISALLAPIMLATICKGVWQYLTRQPFSLRYLYLDRVVVLRLIGLALLIDVLGIPLLMVIPLNSSGLKVVLLLIWVPIMCWLYISFMFSTPLIADRNVTVDTALRESYNQVMQDWASGFGICIVIGGLPGLTNATLQFVIERLLTPLSATSMVIGIIGVTAKLLIATITITVSYSAFALVYARIFGLASVSQAAVGEATVKELCGSSAYGREALKRDKPE